MHPPPSTLPPFRDAPAALVSRRRRRLTIVWITALHVAVIAVVAWQWPAAPSPRKVDEFAASATDGPGAFVDEGAAGEATATAVEPDAATTASSLVAGAPAFDARARRTLVDAATPPERATLDGALMWLARHQSPDGSWDAPGFMRNGDPQQGPLCDGAGVANYDVGVSGLSVLAFIGAGQSHRDGTWRETVRRGLIWLKLQQDPEGCFGYRGEGRFTYNHAIATLAMTEAFGVSGSGIWRGPAQAGIDFVLAAQQQAAAGVPGGLRGWHYGARSAESDVSVTGWMSMALRVAATTGRLTVNGAALRGAAAFCREVTDIDTGRVGYSTTGDGPSRAPGQPPRLPAEASESLTAVGVAVRLWGGESPDSAGVRLSADRIAAHRPDWDAAGGAVDMSAWYYGTLTMRELGGAGWEAWRARLREVLVARQRHDGNFAGSWDPIDPWGGDGGRVYATAVLALCLEAALCPPAATPR